MSDFRVGAGVADVAGLEGVGVESVFTRLEGGFPGPVVEDFEGGVGDGAAFGEGGGVGGEGGGLRGLGVGVSADGGEAVDDVGVGSLEIVLGERGVDAHACYAPPGYSHLLIHLLGRHFRAAFEIADCEAGEDDFCAEGEEVVDVGVGAGVLGEDLLDEGDGVAVGVDDGGAVGFAGVEDEAVVGEVVCGVGEVDDAFAGQGVAEGIGECV
jgi:hypothetical protein